MLLYKFSTTRFFAKIPFTYTWILKRAIGEDVETILDLGCAKGISTKVIAKGENWIIDGVELYSDYIKEARRSGVYRRVVRGDIANLPKSIASKNYDVVLCHQVLEHLEKKEGKKAIKKWEEIASKRVVIGTPVGFIKYEHTEEINRPDEDNELIQHKSGWGPPELKKLGYQVRGQGLRLIYGESGLARKFPSWLLPFFKFVSYLASPMSFFSPSIAQVMICKKELGR